MSSERRLMTTAEYAAHRKCSDSYIRRMRRHDRLVTVGDLIDADASDKLLAATTDPVRGGDRTERPGAASGPETRSEAAEAPWAGSAAANGPETRPDAAAGASSPAADFIAQMAAGADLRRAMARERDAKAKLAELELAERTGALVRKREIAGAVFTLARQAVNRLQLVRSRLKYQLAAAATPGECDQLLDAEIRLICADMQQAANELMTGTADQAESAAAEAA